MEHEGDNYTNCDRYFWCSNKSIIKVTGGLGSWRTSGDILNSSLLRNARILRRVLETWGDLLSLKHQRKTISYRWCVKLWYVNNMHNPAPVLENDSHKLLWDFNIQTDHLIPTRRPDLIIINKKKENLRTTE